MFDDWLVQFDTKMRAKIIVGAAAIYWAIWLSRNDMVFDKCPMKTYMQVIYGGTFWCRFWAQLQRREEDVSGMKVACLSLETSVLKIFTRFGWSFRNRIAE